MDRTATDQTIKVLLSEIHRRLDDAARIAKAAEACAIAGSKPKVSPFRWISNN